jgi:hypothetical protein
VRTTKRTVMAGELVESRATRQRASGGQSTLYVRWLAWDVVMLVSRGVETAG